MKDIPEQEKKRIEIYVQKIRDGYSAEEAKRLADMEVKRVDIGDPKIRLKSTDAEMLKAYMEEDELNDTTVISIPEDVVFVRGKFSRLHTDDLYE